MAHRDFPASSGYLNTASFGLPPASAVAAMRDAVDAWAGGSVQPPDYDASVGAARAAFARLHGVAPECVAAGPQVSYFVGLVAQSLAPRAEVVLYDGEFSSLLFPFLVRGDLDVRLAPLDRLADAIGPGTELVAVSAVQSADGRVADLEAIAAAADAHGALSLIDSTQASGWLPIDGARFDFLTAGTYKWLLSPRGTAFMAVRPERLETLPPLAAGWYAGADPWQSLYGPPLRLAADARRLDMSPGWLAWVATAVAMEYLETVGVEAIHAHDLRLANTLRNGLGLPPSDSAIVSVERDGAAEALARAGITAAVRAGELRASFHLYNDLDDVDAVLRALESS